MKAQTGRADLLRRLAFGIEGDFTLDHDDGAWFGLQHEQADSPPDEPSLLSLQPGRAEVVSPGAAAEPKPSRRPLRMPDAWVVTSRRTIEQSSLNRPSAEEPLTAVDLRGGEASPRARYQHLMPWARLNPVLRQRLSNTLQRGLDVPALTSAITRQRLPRHLPLQQRRHWNADLMVVLDFSERLFPYRFDTHQLAKQLKRQCAATGLSIRIMQHGPAGGWTPWFDQPPLHDIATPQAWRMPHPGATVLIVGDLGLVAHDAGIHQAWLIFAAAAKHAGVDVGAFVPLSAEQLPADTCRQIPVLRWSPDSRLRREHGVEHPGVNERDLASMLALVAAAHRVDPPLLRALRRSVPGAELNAGLEGAVWAHPDVLAGHTCRVRKDAEDEHLAQFERLEPALIEHQQTLRQAHHQHLRAALRVGEDLHWASHAHGSALVDQVEEAAVDFLRRLMCTLAEGGTPDSLAPWRQATSYLLKTVDEQTILRHQATLDALSRCLSVAKEGGRLGLGATREVHRRWKLIQYGESLRLEFADSKAGGARLVGDLTTDQEMPWVRVQIGQQRRWLPASSPRLDVAKLADSIDEIHIELGADVVAFARLARPVWATGWCRTQSEIRAQFTGPWGKSHEIQYPQPTSTRFVWRRGTACEWDGGADEYGLHMAFTLINGVSQRLRYIPPTTFLMGSPDAESGRDADEGPQHPVTLTRGYWLADTTCTQALWQAVMGGKNPSHFKGSDDLPVDSVSWDDAQAFLAKLQALLPEGCEAVLPTEAEWECACRAGSATPFSFGEQITPAQVNYEGNHPYNGGAKGEYRECTLPVKSLPANAWGLYEMHGNLWEWCADTHRKYADRPEVDPHGGTDGARRVLRGGSWDRLAVDCRSACRGVGVRVLRGRRIGFRFALRSRSPGGGAGVLEAPEGTRAEPRAVSAPAEPGPADAAAGGIGAIVKRLFGRGKKGRSKR